MESHHRFSRAIRAVGVLLVAGLLATNLGGETAAPGTCAGSLQARIDAAPSGATVTADPCVYRETVTIDKPLTLEGQPGSGIRGSDVWTGFTQSGSTWVSSKTVPSFSANGRCAPNTSDCLRPEQVFLDGKPLEQLADGAAPSSGQFALDSGRRVVLGDDPSGKTVEVSVRREWVVGRAPGVTIRGFTMRHAANDSQYRAALTNGGYADWTLEDSELSDSHGALVSFRKTSGLRISNNELHHGGQLGVHASDGHLTLSGNEIRDNNVSGFDPGWEAGGVKAVRMQGLLAENNRVYGNDGNGLWCDVGCRDATYRTNTVHHNGWSGIFFEVSDGAKIHGNVVYENGWGKAGSSVGSWQGAIHISNSRNAEVYDNTVAWNRSNISVVRRDRSGDYPAYNDVYGNYVHDNQILSRDYPSSDSYNSGDRTHALAWLDKWTGEMYASEKNNRGYSNDYYFATPQSSTIPRYFWGGKGISSLTSFNATLGEMQGRYLTRSEKDALVASKGIPASPEHATVDTTPPETTIDSGPSDTEGANSATFAFSSSEPAGASFECKLDGGAFEACTSPKNHTGLANGGHTFQVRAIDAAGNADPTPAGRTWTVDGAPAQDATVLTAATDAKISEGSPDSNHGSFDYLGADGDTLEGRDDAALLKWDLSAIAPGTKVGSASIALTVTDGSSQTYEIYALKRAWSETEATWNASAAGQPWEAAGAQGALDREATVAGTVTSTATGKQTFAIPLALVQGWIDDPSSNHGIVIADAANTNALEFYSRESTGGSQRPALIINSDVDDFAPETTIDSGPSGTASGNPATFAFSSSEAGSTFECALDGDTFGRCSSPKSYSGLANGEHKFRVRATDAAGNTDPTPVGRIWTVDGASGDAAVLAGAGDIADCSSTDDEATAALLDGIAGTVFTVGDNAYQSGTDAEFRDCYGPTWGRHKARTRPAVGNHDYFTENASGYFNYFGEAAGDPGKGYYSYDLGEWHVVVLNSMCEKVGGCSATSPMVRWLKEDLGTNPKPCTLAYFHHPLFSSGKHGDQAKMKPAWEALYSAGADVVVNGNDHDYERFAPQDPDGVADPTRGIRQFVVGTGGDNLHTSMVGTANSEVRNADSHGVLKLTLRSSSYEWEFVPVAGKTFTDSGANECH